MSEWKMQRDEVEKLISYYKRYKCLWDFRSNEYKRYDLKKYAWQKLGKLFGKEASEVKRKIKYLRSAYVAEKKKVDDSYGTSRIYRPNLFYYDDLNFLDSIIVCRKGPRFESFENSSDPIGGGSECKEQPLENTLKVQYVGIEDEVFASASPSPPPSPPKKPADSRLKVKNQSNRLAPYYSKLDAAVTKLAEVSKSTTEDSIYTAFGKTIALQLSQLPPLDATATMSEIYQSLSKNIIKAMLSKNRHSAETKERSLDMETENYPC
ncbi:uncharacterized protein LOC129906242 [Episyrphus balteatus]|uniref:uncharacterized protein LOC129906242 n=1 Tax=Episyrphus balteatus TaxID=286459 RepID=UPI0024869736|nr:uncharacterized protein LOC129906242 [Episyrphus balteatus]